MIDFNLMENMETLLSHRKIYDPERTVADILGKSHFEAAVDAFNLVLCETGGKKFRFWAASSIPAAIEKTELVRKHAIYSRDSILICWKKVLASKKICKGNKESVVDVRFILHELFSKKMVAAAGRHVFI